ncbi:hypothetical protein [Cylindrospermum sp. FACHB-282]|uniref:hypothetical protein n=1 Tax=Cylindrospermum sp. FACHB-282 TaxID=2692794 RepID=UPI00168A124C|nr:hypothetical protein [Cylindrospermum sp. FACHB-282]MBD2386022.1 hypothetical protein [Cylindrospermum sp. FACHB-282]
MKQTRNMYQLHLDRIPWAKEQIAMLNQWEFIIVSGIENGQQYNQKMLQEIQSELALVKAMLRHSEDFVRLSEIYSISPKIWTIYVDFQPVCQVSREQEFFDWRLQNPEISNNRIQVSIPEWWLGERARIN